VGIFVAFMHQIGANDMHLRIKLWWGVLRLELKRHFTHYFPVSIIERNARYTVGCGAYYPQLSHKLYKCIHLGKYEVRGWLCQCVCIRKMINYHHAIDCLFHVAIITSLISSCHSTLPSHNSSTMQKSARRKEVVAEVLALPYPLTTCFLVSTAFFA
jgi:hypothetical protein